MLWFYLTALLPVAPLFLVLLYNLAVASMPRPKFSPVGHTLMLVDDDTKVCETTGKKLQRQGYMVLAAADAEGALNLAKTYPGQIDLLITDVLMPGMSGPLLAEHWQRLRPLTSILFISGIAEEDTVPYRHSPSMDFLSKPFTFDALSQRVHRALAARRCVA